MVIYIAVEYCSGCDLYYKHIGRRLAANCEVCGERNEFKMVEKYSAQDPNLRIGVVNITYKDNPRYSASMGVSEKQIEEARKLHPQAEWKKFGHSYRPLIKNRTDKLRMMKQCGMEEFGVEQFKGKG